MSKNSLKLAKVDRDVLLPPMVQGCARKSAHSTLPDTSEHAFLEVISLAFNFSHFGLISLSSESVMKS